MKCAKSLAFLAPLAAFALAFAVLLTEKTPPVIAQEIPADPMAQAREMDALIKEIGEQQLEIAKSMTEVETRLAALEESLRQARIFSARSGRNP